MFGFGMSPNDKWILEQTELIVTPLARLTGDDAKKVARKLFDDTKAEHQARFGDVFYAQTHGDNLITNEVLLAPRIAAGLTVEDVRSYWNMPVLFGLIQAAFQEAVDIMTITNASSQGKDPVEFRKEQRKREALFGDPQQWNPSLPVNQGFTSEDADIYPEFMVRVGEWGFKTSAAERAALLSQYTSYNAMIRALIREGEL